MMVKKLISFVTVLLVLSAWAPTRATGEEAQIRDILITTQGYQVLVYARLTNCFTKDMEAAIMAGVPTTFTFLLNLYQQRSGWPDKKISDSVITHTIKYDSLKKTFYVSSSLDRDPVLFRDLESAKRAMSEFNGSIPLPSDLRKNLPHYVMMRAKLDKVRLPLHMEYLFFFVSLWDFETAWYRQPVVF
jgi:hypothetical protein